MAYFYELSINLKIEYMATVIAVVSVLVLIRAFGVELLTWILRGLTLIIVPCVKSILPGAIGWGILYLVTGSLSIAVIGFVIGFVIGLIFIIRSLI